MPYEPVIGMEVHVELHTASKIFCSCPADHFQQPPNIHICPVCTAQPGALPVINGHAVALTIMTGMAFNCRINRHNVFARKNYIYPDLPKGYQISQYEFPLCEDGTLEIETAAGTKRIGIERVHLEEDTGKLVHQGNSSLVDYNRAGMPLMEIVSDASIRSAEEAYAYLWKIRQIVRYLGASTADMEKGDMRCEANISVRPNSEAAFGTKVEVKNLNSFRAVRNAIDYEIKRQIQTIEEGGAVRQVTMGWDENSAVTREQRSKETSEDYRYFPEPDLLNLDLEETWIAKLQTELPELPDAKTARFASAFGLSSQDIAVLIEDQEIATYFEQAVKHPGADPKQVCNWMTVEFFRHLKETSIEIKDCKVTPTAMVELLTLVNNKTINQNAAKEVFAELWEKGGLPADIVAARGLTQISDTSALEGVITAVLGANNAAVEKIKSGDLKPLNFLKGQVMRETRGKANPQTVDALLRQQLGV